MIIGAKRRYKVKNHVIAVFLATLISIPAVAAFAQSADVVIVGGKAIGQDPDANVRLQLRRDSGSEGY
jgi:hypothetical protein